MIYVPALIVGATTLASGSLGATETLNQALIGADLAATISVGHWEHAAERTAPRSEVGLSHRYGRSGAVVRSVYRPSFPNLADLVLASWT